MTNTKDKDNYDVTCTATYSDSTNFEITDTKKLYSQGIDHIHRREFHFSVYVFMNHDVYLKKALHSPF